MKYLYLRYLNFRLWLLRRRLHRRLRRLGIAKDVPKTGRPVSGQPSGSREIFDCIKIAIGVIGIISMWLIFFLHQNGAAEARPTPRENPSLAVPFMPLKSEIFSF